MKTLTTALALATGLAAIGTLPLPGGPEERAVRAAVEHYLAGHATGRGEHFERAFHPEGRLLWVREGALQQRSSAEYIAGARGAPAQDEAKRKRRIADLDVTGDAAVAKVVLDYPGARFVDYMSLLKVEGEWRIVSKVFHREAR